MWRVLGAAVALGALAVVPMHAAGFDVSVMEEAIAPARRLPWSRQWSTPPFW